MEDRQLAPRVPESESHRAWALPVSREAERWAISRRYGGVKRCAYFGKPILRVVWSLLESPEGDYGHQPPSSLPFPLSTALLVNRDSCSSPIAMEFQDSERI
jgi:hypothetical protein